MIVSSKPLFVGKKPVSVSKRSINKVLLACFVLICLLMPVDVFSIKKALMILLVLINITTVFQALKMSNNLFITFFGFLFPTLLIAYSVLLTGDLVTSFSRSYVLYMLLLVFIIKQYQIDYEHIFLSGVTVVMGITLLLFLLDITGIADANSSYIRTEIIYKYQIGLMGKHTDYTFYYKIFLKTSPLIVFLTFRKFSQGKYLFALLAFAALFLSGTRANVGFTLIFLAFYCANHNRKKTLPALLTIALFATAAMAVFYAEIIQKLFVAFVDNTQVSSTIRRDMLRSLVDLVKQKPWVILTGTGMGSPFFSLAQQVYLESFEWSFLDLWRQMGFVFFSVFLLFAFYPLRPKSKIPADKKYAYMAYLCIAATNPLLFSSTAFLAYIYMYYDADSQYELHTLGRGQIYG